MDGATVSLLESVWKRTLEFGVVLWRPPLTAEVVPSLTIRARSSVGFAGEGGAAAVRLAALTKRHVGPWTRMASSMEVAAPGGGLSESLVTALRDSGQEHLLQHWLSLPEGSEDRAEFARQLEGIDFVRATRIFRVSTANEHKSDENGGIEPMVEGVCSKAGRTAAQEDAWRNLGLKAVAEGKLAVVLLAGGQGTRLGSSAPKGCFDIGLPSHKSLFQLQAERLLRVQQLSARQEGISSLGRRPVIPWYIMTSPFTHDATRAFFETHNFLGLDPLQVRLFQQGCLPSFTEDGKLILETPSKLALAPDGNGGVYAALQASGCLDDMARCGIEFVECLSVDNALVRVADPVFLGFCVDRNAPCAAKVVAKAYPEEKVGVFAQRRRGCALSTVDAAPAGSSVTSYRVGVVEYSEIPGDLASSRDPRTGELRFNWSNICLHMFSLPFLESVASALEQQSLFHVARKAIPSLGGLVRGIKLEQFIFDVFPLAPSVALLEVVREEEFSPVKNAPGSSTDSPATARKHILRLHRQWVENAGGRVESPGSQAVGGVHGIEVSPLASYAGEGLADLCSGKAFPAGTEIGA